MSTYDPDESPDAATPEGLAPSAKPKPTPVLRSGTPRRRRSRKRIYVAGGVVLLAIGFLIFKGVTSAFVYFKTADQAIADRATLGNSSFQIEGTVVPGTLPKGSYTGDFSFLISSNKVRVRIDNSGEPPQLFGPGVPVVLYGHFVGATNTFASDQILVKHSNSYIAAHPNRVRASNGSLH